MRPHRARPVAIIAKDTTGLFRLDELLAGWTGVEGHAHSCRDRHVRFVSAGGAGDDAYTASLLQGIGLSSLPTHLTASFKILLAAGESFFVHTQMQHGQHGQTPILQHFFFVVFVVMVCASKRFITSFCIVGINYEVFKRSSGRMVSKVSLHVQPIDPSCAMVGKGFCPCPLEDVAGALSGKWTLTILVTIGNFSTLRFNGLLSRIPKLNPKTLSNRLKDLEGMGLISRKVYAEKPPRVEYKLTKEGAHLRKAVIPLMKWVARITK